MQNLVYKILFNHLISGNLRKGEEILLNIDQAYMEDHSGVDIFARLQAMQIDKICNKLVVCYTDHNILSKPEDMQSHLFLANCCSKYGALYSRSASGICHQLHAECFTVPGAVILGANSHTPYCGGMGSLAFGVGGLELTAVLADLPYSFQMPYVININLSGFLNDFCSVKDLALLLKRELVLKKNSIIEFSGSGVCSLTIPQRMLLTSMCVEIGAITGVFPSDVKTLEYMICFNREDSWIPMQADKGATYDEEYHVDLGEIEPMIALPAKNETIVEIKNLKEAIPIQQIIVGGCTSGYIDDIATVANILRNKTISSFTNMIVQPSSKRTLELMAKNGLMQSLLQSCVEITPPSCDACIGMNYVPSPNTNSLRTFSRNYQGRSGCKNDHVYLCSVETASVSALTGEITDPRTFTGNLSSCSSFVDFHKSHLRMESKGFISPRENENTIRLLEFVPLCPLIQKNEDLFAKVVLKLNDAISTDDIVPHGTDINHHRADIRGLSDYVFFRLDTRFAQRIKENAGGWILAGSEFGRGSARENAAHVLAFMGIKGILAKSFSYTYINNMVNHALYPVVVTDEMYQDISEDDVLEVEYYRDDKIYLTNRTTNQKYIVNCILTQRQRNVLFKGGLFEYLINQK